MSCSRTNYLPPLNANALIEAPATPGGAPLAGEAPLAGNQIPVMAPTTPPAEVVLQTNTEAASTASKHRSVPRWIRVSLLDLRLGPEKMELSAAWGRNRVIEAYHAGLHHRTYADLLRACSKKVPRNRAIRTIEGATCAPSIVDTWVIPDYHLNLNSVSLSDDEEVLSWLLHTLGVVPLHILATLHRMGLRTKVGNQQSPGIVIRLTMGRGT